MRVLKRKIITYCTASVIVFSLSIFSLVASLATGKDYPFTSVLFYTITATCFLLGLYSLFKMYRFLNTNIFSFLEFLGTDSTDWDEKSFNLQFNYLSDYLKRAFKQIIGMKNTIFSLHSLSGNAILEIEDYFSKQLKVAEQVAEGAKLQIDESLKASRAVREIDGMTRKLEADMQELSSNAEGAASAILEMSSSIDHVGEMAVNLDKAVSDSSASLEEMSYSFKQVFNAIQELNRATKHTSAALDSITLSIEEVEQNALNSAQIAQETALSAEEGSFSVEESTKGMEQIDLAVKDSAKIIRSLSERSDRIGEILNIIDDIADQTNLLALNASIIAAQAGDEGKSFAVVAQEIRQLAEKTAISTKEIDDLITAVQLEAEEAVRSMEVGTEAVERGVRLSSDSARVLQKISDCAHRTEQVITKISEATSKQMDTSREVKSSMNKMNDRVKGINTAIEEHEKARAHILNTTEMIGSLSTQLKRATQEQTKGSKSINESIVSVADKIQSVYELAKNQSIKSKEIREVNVKIDEIASKNNKSIGELQSVALGLSEQIGYFKKEISRKGTAKKND